MEASGRFTPAGEWDQLGDDGKVFFRKHEAYDADWSYVDFENYKIVCASHGGPLALYRDVEKPMLLGAGTLPLSAVHVFSSSGEKRCIINISKMERIAGLHWTPSLDLLCVFDHGYVQKYSLSGDSLPDEGFFLGAIAKEKKVVQVSGSRNALVARTTNHQFILVKDVLDPIARLLPDPKLSGPPASVQVLQTLRGCIAKVEVFVAWENTVVVMDENAAEDQLLNLPSPIRDMCLSPNGQLLALLHEDGFVRVLSSDFSKHLSCFDTGSPSIPRQTAWCGLDAVLLDFKESLMLIGPYGDCIRYPYDDLVLIQQEIDGARIFSSSKIEFLGKVPTASQDIFQIGSVAPAALLYDAKRYFDHGSIKADENMREIGEQRFPQAVKHCIEAGLTEWAVDNQQALLRAAAFGLVYCKPGSVDPDMLKDACQSLRVLNAIREVHIGFLLTYPQLVQLDYPMLLTWLAKSRQHLLALRIAEMIGSGAQDVTENWAIAKISAEVSNGLSDEVLCNALYPKLRSCTGVPIARIAEYAHSVGRPKLATRILEIEASPSQYVPLYLRLGEDVLALDKSIESGDEDLVNLCILHMLKNRQLKDFLKLVVERPSAAKLFIVHCRMNDPDLLETFYLYLNKPDGIAESCIEQVLAGTPGKNVGRGSSLTSAQLMERAAKAYAQNKNCTVESKSAEEAARLVKVQSELESPTSGMSIKGLSLAQTLSHLLIAGQEKAALRLKNDFKMSERAYVTIKAASLVERRNWDNLLLIARNKRLPLPHDSIVSLAVNSGSGGAPRQVIESLIECIPDTRLRAEVYSQNNFAAQAEAIMQQDKDSEFITRLFGKMGT